ncbi:unnamed protein product [Chondrus crispus]|uniref:Secreted protein n=1 Tax=Chondrus crispus TaxID=2769 RepID=R7Q6D1_CHOCR|nr:unnamed protein product [Chondrus crispus]CDF32946.1 unnamed protein product [Chondrus crispus]|eukprot:XP_005712749.1 unnamed protein product [Chondrus crispus]
MRRVIILRCSPGTMLCALVATAKQVTANRSRLQQDPCAGKISISSSSYLCFRLTPARFPFSHTLVDIKQTFTQTS